MGRIVEHGCTMAEFAEKIIRESPGWEIISPAQLGIVNFRFISNQSMSECDLDRMNQEIAREVTESGYAQIYTTRLRAKTVLRMCTINPETTEADILGTIEKMKQARAARDRKR